MSLKIEPPFKVVLNISDEINLNPYEVNLRQLRDAVLGRDLNFPRSRAMSLLLASDFPNKHRDFEMVLEDEEESPEIRYLAAMYLSKINTPAAIEILVNNSQIRHELVLSGVMKALGRIGNESVLNIISEVKECGQGIAVSEAKFAAALISYRLGLVGNELTIPDDKDYLEIPRKAARPFQVNLADEVDAELCLRSLAKQPFGIEFAEYPMYQIHCKQNNWMILINREFVDENAVQKLIEQKAFFGAITSRSEETGLYSVAFLLLTSPRKQSSKVNVLIYLPTGDPIFSGTGQLAGESIKFTIRAISRPGAFPMHIEGIFEDGQLEIKTALSGLFVQNKQQPKQEYAVSSNT
jgi:hypothetical protein